MRPSFVLSSATVLAFSLLGLAGCVGGGSDRESVGCPAIVSTDEPSLLLVSVQDGRTSAPIPVVLLSELTVGGRSLNPEPFMASQGLNVRLAGNALECTLPCGFTNSTSEISFTVSATGYAPLKVTDKGAYSARYGECPPVMTGGKRIAVKLQPV